VAAGSASCEEQKPLYLYFTTIGWKSGRDHEIEIWFTTEHGGCFYLIAETREKAHWVRNVRQEPRVRVRIEAERFESVERVVEPSAEPELTGRVRELAEAKYGWSDGLIVEHEPDRR
jgi:hypothetical protein